MNAIVTLLIYIAVFAIAAIVIFYLLSQFNLPEPIGKIIKIVLVVVAGIVAILIILQAGGISPRFGRAESSAPAQVAQWTPPHTARARIGAVSAPLLLPSLLSRQS